MLMIVVVACVVVVVKFVLICCYNHSNHNECPNIYILSNEDFFWVLVDFVV